MKVIPAFFKYQKTWDNPCVITCEINYNLKKAYSEIIYGSFNLEAHYGETALKRRREEQRRSKKTIMDMEQRNMETDIPSM